MVSAPPECYLLAAESKTIIIAAEAIEEEQCNDNPDYPFAAVVIIAVIAHYRISFQKLINYSMDCMNPIRDGHFRRSSIKRSQL